VERAANAAASAATPSRAAGDDDADPEDDDAEPVDAAEFDAAPDGAPDEHEVSRSPDIARPTIGMRKPRRDIDNPPS
jgi:hypothetical protein